MVVVASGDSCGVSSGDATCETHREASDNVLSH